MATRTSQLVVELLDRVSGPARRVTEALAGIRNSATGGGVGGGFTDRINTALQNTNTRLADARAGLVDAAGAFFAIRAAIGAPLREASRFETALEDIGQKADIPTEKLAALGERIKDIARQTNQGVFDISSSIDALVGRGVSVDTALKVADPIGRAAFAYRAATEDLAATATVVTDNLKVPAEQMEQALDILAQAGKEGAFELRDMARFLPDLGARYAAAGQTGVDALADLAAAAQAMRKDTGDASAAATRLANVLQKTYSPATIRKFSDQGVDVLAEMQKAAERGLTPLEAIAEITERTLGGDLTRIGSLFEDAEAQAGIRSLIQHRDEYRRIRAEALAAQGVVMKDYQRRVETAEGAQRRWNASLQTLNVTLGAALLPVMNDLLDRIVPLIGYIGDWISANPELVAGIMSAVAAMVALRGSIALLRFAGLLGQSGALALLAAGMNTVGAAAIRLGGAARSAISLQTALGAMSGGQTLGTLSKLGIGLRAAVMAVPGVSALGGAISAIGAAVATISAPVWGAFALAAAAIAAAGVTIWKYWDRITAVMSGVGQALGEILAPALDAIRPALDWLAPLGDVIAAGWERAKTAIAAVGEWLGSLFQKEVLTEDEKGKAKQAGYDFIMSLWNGMKQVFIDMKAWLDAKVAELLAPITALADKVSSILPSFGAAEGVTSDPMGTGVEARAGGGPVRKGRPYLVGEEGPELITPSADGFVHPAAQTRRMLSGGGASRATGGTGRGAGVVINLGGITVHAAPGMDERQIVREAMRQIEEKIGASLRGVQADTGMEAYG